jgi:NAD(P)-dependent dehydrogenase (short-subunit alcohol dehydrogenase family)
MNGLGRTFLIYGASRGLGKAIVNLVPEAQDKVYGVSRSIPKNNAQLNWICAIYLLLKMRWIKLKKQSKMRK